jgi:hypothetical protein
MTVSGLTIIRPASLTTIGRAKPTVTDQPQSSSFDFLPSLPTALLMGKCDDLRVLYKNWNVLASEQDGWLSAW